MTSNVLWRTGGCLIATVALTIPVQAKQPAHTSHHSRAKWVAYDQKDRKYYSVGYAKAHGMHDRGGDRLIVILRSRLPKGAKLSRAMHNVEP